MIEHAQPIPLKCDVLIIGGGPAGSSTASLLAKQGVDVVLLEKARFPRNQVGESLIPHFWKFADLTGVSEKIEKQGFVTKAGGITVWDGVISQISFAQFGYNRPALHVERDVFDELLLEYADECGASVFQEVSVKAINFSDEGAPQAFYYDKRRNSSQSEGKIVCQYVVDASGHSSLLANQFRTRQLINSKLKFLSLWGYFKNSRYIGLDAKSHSAESLPHIKPVTFVTSCGDGWLWHIILRDKTSVGLIIHTDRTRGMDKRARERFFLETCSNTPYLKELLECASYIENSLQFRPDYSYYSTNPCGENYYCIGDAAAFVDPIFSHGVQSAFYNAAVAAVAIKASLDKKSHRKRYSQICESRMQQFYGFARAMALGDFGGDGVKPELVKNLMKGMPLLELELMLAASEITNRSGNFREMAKEAGVLEEFAEGSVHKKAKRLDALML